jgi:hypothetical protein
MDNTERIPEVEDLNPPIPESSTDVRSEKEKSPDIFSPKFSAVLERFTGFVDPVDADPDYDLRRDMTLDELKSLYSLSKESDRDEDQDLSVLCELVKADEEKMDMLRTEAKTPDQHLELTRMLSERRQRIGAIWSLANQYREGLPTVDSEEKPALTTETPGSNWRFGLEKEIEDVRMQLQTSADDDAKKASDEIRKMTIDATDRVNAIADGTTTPSVEPVAQGTSKTDPVTSYDIPTGFGRGPSSPDMMSMENVIDRKRAAEYMAQNGGGDQVPRMTTESIPSVSTESGDTSSKEGPVLPLTSPVPDTQTAGAQTESPNVDQEAPLDVAKGKEWYNASAADYISTLKTGWAEGASPEARADADKKYQLLMDRIKLDPKLSTFLDGIQQPEHKGGFRGFFRKDDTLSNNQLIDGAIQQLQGAGVDIDNPEAIKDQAKHDPKYRNLIATFGKAAAIGALSTLLLSGDDNKSSFASPNLPESFPSTEAVGLRRESANYTSPVGNAEIATPEVSTNPDMTTPVGDGMNIAPDIQPVENARAQFGGVNNRPDIGTGGAQFGGDNPANLSSENNQDMSVEQPVLPVDSFIERFGDVTINIPEGGNREQAVADWLRSQGIDTNTAASLAAEFDSTTRALGGDPVQPGPWTVTSDLRNWAPDQLATWTDKINGAISQTQTP